MRKFICSVCNKLQSVTDTGTNTSFQKTWIDENGLKGFGRKCTPCSRAGQRAYRKKRKNHVTRKYEKTVAGYLMRAYQNMKGRVTGIQSKKAHLYVGKEIVDRSEFYRWSETDPNFNDLFTKYVESGFDMKLAPSINRKDSKYGYTFDNMEWITHSENSRQGAVSRHHGES